MGYFGLPSKACAPCRGRRIKCDLGRPSCGQCLRISKECHGYRNYSNLIFHDQTTEISHKVQRAKRTSQITSVEIAPEPAHARSHYAQKQACSQPTPLLAATSPESLSLPFPLAEQAFYYFYTNYASRPSQNFTTIYESVPALYLASPDGSALSNIITALGLSGLVYHTSTYGLENTAAISYNKALRQLTKTLRDPELAKEDLTLLVVLLLCLYETVTCRTPRSLKSWHRHMVGATALLELRGEKQLATDLGRALFVQARAHIIAGCFQTRTAMPDVIVRLSQRRLETKAVSPNERVADPYMLDTMFPITFRFSYLRSLAPFNPTPNQPESLTRLFVREYTTLSEQIEAWFRTLPSCFTPANTTSKNPSPAKILENCQVYDVWTAGALNNCRISSLLVSEALVLQLTHLRDNYARDPAELVELDASILRARTAISTRVDAICVTVPHLLQSNMAVAGVGLLWALFVSAQISSRALPLNDARCDWVLGCLERIGSEMGVEQATTLVGLLRKGVGVERLLEDMSTGADEGDD